MGRTGTDSITLALHCVRTRPAGEEVRLRLDLFDARFFLSGSVVHYAPCRAGPIRSRGFSSSVAAAGFTRSLPSQYCLVSLNRSNPSASTPSLKPHPPARLTRPKCVVVPPKINHPCQSRKDRHLSPDRHTVRLLPRLSACLLTLRKTERTMLTHRPFRLPPSRAEGDRTLQCQ